MWAGGSGDMDTGTWSGLGVRGVGSREMWTQEERLGISRHGGVVGDVGTGDERTRGNHREGKCIRIDMEEIYRENAEASKRGGKRHRARVGTQTRRPETVKKEGCELQSCGLQKYGEGGGEDGLAPRQFHSQACPFPYFGATPPLPIGPPWIPPLSEFRFPLASPGLCSD